MIKDTLAVAATAAALTLMASLPAAAQPRTYDRGYDEGYQQGYRSGFDDARADRRYDDRNSNGAYETSAPPPRVAGNRDQRWRSRYQRAYTYNDDVFYQQCRQSVDPGGVIAGALIGGLLGNAIGRGGARGPATAAGVIVGGAVGGTLTRNLDCADRSYAYKTYYDGFNSGRANSRWNWRNPNNGNYGEFLVGDYYTDPDGFRCSTYTQRVYVSGRPQTASGRACQQPDGSWTIVS